MKVKEIMTKDVISVTSEDSIYFSINKMADHDIGFLPVIDNGELKGIFTDRDIILTLADDFSLEDKVFDIMEDDVITINEDADDVEASNIMGANQIRRLVVVNNDKDVVGILTLRDLVNSSTHEHELFATMEEISSEFLDLSNFTLEDDRSNDDESDDEIS